MKLPRYSSLCKSGLDNHGCQPAWHKYMNTARRRTIEDAHVTQVAAVLMTATIIHFLCDGRCCGCSSGSKLETWSDCSTEPASVPSASGL